MGTHAEKDWHQRHKKQLTLSQQLADDVTKVLGSWRFIITQTVLVAIWVVLNLTALVYRWDPYPFILLNLMFSVQAAYAAPIIMMAQNRQAERDRYQSQADYHTDLKAEREIEEIKETLTRLEATKIDPILEHLQNK